MAGQNVLAGTGIYISVCIFPEKANPIIDEVES
jgi:hypothetical protein